MDRLGMLCERMVSLVVGPGAEGRPEDTPERGRLQRGDGLGAWTLRRPYHHQALSKNFG